MLLELEVIDDDCVFDGALKDDIATVTGDKCFPIAPTSDPNKPGRFTFDRQMLLDIGVSLSTSSAAKPPSANLTHSSRLCKVCKKIFKKRK